MSDWKLIYETDATGVRLFGNLSEFRSAIMNGADVKVLYSVASGAWWSRYCASVNVSGFGGNTRIAATFMGAGDTHVTGDGLVFERDPFTLEYHIYNTTGHRDFVKIAYPNHSIVENDNKIIRMKWFVKDYALPNLFLDPEILSTVLERIGG